MLLNAAECCCFVTTSRTGAWGQLQNSVADTDAPGCRRLQICLRERPHVIGKPHPPYRCLTAAASLLLPHSTEIPLGYLYIWQPQRSLLPRLVAGSHNDCVQTAEIKKSDWRLGQFRHDVQDHAKAVFGMIGVWMLILCAHTAPCLSSCVCSYYSLSVSLCVLILLLVCLPVCWSEQCGRALVHCAHARAQ